MLIALTGKALAGKDTVGAILHDQGFCRTAFADPLKRSAMIKFGLSEDQVYTQEGKREFVFEYMKTVRELLQLEGTEATQPVFGFDFWVRRWLMTYNELKNQGNHDVVITDCRFDHEAEAVRGLGGYVINIIRPNATETLQGSEAAHKSEQGVNLTLVSAQIVNDGSIEALAQTVLHAIAVLAERAA